MDTDIKDLLKNLEVENKAYYTLCMCTYYCFLRRTELTKLLVKNISLDTGTITIEATASKNKKTDVVTIPNVFLPLLAEHIVKANNNDFVFSSNNFKTGGVALQPKKISDTWEKFRKKYSVAKEHQFYGLKDTGITDLLQMGVPTLKVKNQARHHSITMTEKYVPHNKKVDDYLKNLEYSF